MGGGESDLSACSPLASFSVHMASSAVTLAWSVHNFRGNNVVRIWVEVELRDDVCCVCECYRGGIVVMDVFLASTLCRYELRKCDLFVLSWVRVRRVRWEVSPHSC